jgi:aspartate 1-decarboxylase
MIEVLKSKIHRATVTGADLHYEGSITISKELIDAAGILAYQKVSIADINNGNRFDTYVIVTEKPGIVCLNGAAARMVSIGDLIIIMSYQLIDEEKACNCKPKVIQLEANNTILKQKEK